VLVYWREGEKSGTDCALQFFKFRRSNYLDWRERNNHVVKSWACFI